MGELDFGARMFPYFPTDYSSPTLSTRELHLHARIDAIRVRSSHLNSIKNAIKNHKIHNLVIRLIHPMNKAEFYSTIPGYAIETPKNFLSETATLEVKPYVEWLYDEPEYFIWVVKLLQQANSFAVYNALLKSLEYTDLKQDYLFSWNDAIQNESVAQIKGIKRYAKHLIAYNIEKGSVLSGLARQLTMHLQHGPKLKYNEAHFRNRLRILEYKLRFKQLLHQHDKTLNTHRHSFYLAANLVIVLFTGGVLHLVNHLATGKYLFFANTTSIKHIMQTEQQAQLHGVKVYSTFNLI